MTPKETPGGIDTDQLAELMELVKGSKSVELKLTIPQESTRAAIDALGLDPLDGQIRLVTFFDTPELSPQPGRRRRALPAASRARAPTRS